MGAVFPFSAIVEQAEMKLALLLAAIDPSIGGVLIFGDRGTGKSTAVRGLAELLPPMRVVAGCPYHCDPDELERACDACRAASRAAPPRVQRVAVPVVDLPLGATEDRVLGALDLERAISQGVKAYEPGLLARANRGFLYVDEVNLLEDHLVDLLLDVAASGENVVEREGLSVRHPARLVLIGSCNPEEGELRPQLLDRFGLSVEVKTPADLETRIEVVRQRDEFEADPTAFRERFKRSQNRLRRDIEAARERLPGIGVDDAVRRATSQLCLHLGTDGLRGEIVMLKAARALAALERGDRVEIDQLRRVAPCALRHRLRRDPLDEAGSSLRVERGIAEVLGG